jgi:hypothetical protein
MPLSHFVLEAKKHTPVFAPKPAQTLTIEANAIEGPVSELRSDLKKKMAVMSEAEKAVAEPVPEVLGWKTCKYLKEADDRAFCKQYLSLCAKEKCQKRYMEADFFDFKKYLKQGKCIK